MAIINIDPCAGINNYNVVNNIIKQNDLLIKNVAAEVGVRHGDFSEYILRNNPSITMLLVDHYKPYTDIHYEFTAEEQNEIKEKAIKRLAPLEKSITWYYMESSEAAKLIDLRSLDFVFIDANHEYEYIRRDILAWNNRVRFDGVFCGHDFNMKGVHKAVTEFAEAKKYDIFHIAHPADVWYIFIRESNEQ